MAMSEAKKRANKKWNDANHSAKYDRINILAPKGQKDVIVAAAERANESISQYMLNAARERMEREERKE